MGNGRKGSPISAFRFEDIMRVNNVRNAWCIDHPDSHPMMRSFYDRSMWGKSKAREPETLKALMRNAVVQSSAVCVLIGTNTWKGRWVKYEIARAVIDKRGLLAVHINGLNHIEPQAPDQHGYNPLDCMGIYHSPGGHYYLYELNGEVDRELDRPNGCGDSMKISGMLLICLDIYRQSREAMSCLFRDTLLYMTTRILAMQTSEPGLIVRPRRLDDRLDSPSANFPIQFGCLNRDFPAPPPPPPPPPPRQGCPFP